MRISQTSTSNRRLSRGFSLIEMGVVVLIVALLAALVMPNVARQRDSFERRQFYSELYRFAAGARESAIREQATLALVLDSGGRRIALFEETLEGENERSSVELPEGIDSSSSRMDGQAGGEWRVRFYPDGSSDGGGIELTDNGRVRALEIQPNGSVRMIDGNIEAVGEEKWPAGDYEKRM
jgi:prepilin-type N-terminal cleavage/methylation domain-containing protein